jgi:hypothetical protein
MLTVISGILVSPFAFAGWSVISQNFPPSFRDAPLGAGPESITPIRGYGFRARSLSDKIDVVNFAQSSRPGMTMLLVWHV